MDRAKHSSSRKYPAFFNCASGDALFTVLFPVRLTPVTAEILTQSPDALRRSTTSAAAHIRLGRMSDHEKELEIMILRYQLAIVDRKLQSPPRPSRAEKLTLAVLLARLKHGTQQPASQLRDIIRLFQPDTVLRWHRQRVRHKWSYGQKTKGGRPPISRELEGLIIRLAQENGSWGYGKIEGELLKLGFKVSPSTIRNVLNRHGIVSAPVRHGSLCANRILRHHPLFGDIVPRSYVLARLVYA